MTRLASTANKPPGRFRRIWLLSEPSRRVPRQIFKATVAKTPRSSVLCHGTVNIPQIPLTCFARRSSARLACHCDPWCPMSSANSLAAPQSDHRRHANRRVCKKRCFPQALRRRIPNSRQWKQLPLCASRPMFQIAKVLAHHHVRQSCSGCTTRWQDAATATLFGGGLSHVLCVSAAERVPWEVDFSTRSVALRVAALQSARNRSGNV